jgi:hypothetical protein
MQNKDHVIAQLRDENRRLREGVAALRRQHGALAAERDEAVRRVVALESTLPARSLARHPRTPRFAYPKGERRRTLYEWLLSCGPHGATDAEAEEALGWSHQSLSACRNGLMRDGLVTAAGHRPGGARKAIVWIAVRIPEGEQ